MAVQGFKRLRSRGGRNAARLVIAFSVLCAVAVLGNLAYQVMRGRTDTIAHASRNAAALARVLEAQTIASIDGAELALLATDNALRLLAPDDPARGARIDRLLAENIERLPFIRAIWVLDAKGDMVHDSQHLPGRYNLSDRAYFKIHRDQPRRGLYIDQPIVSKHGVPFIGLSRRIDHADGSFGGVVVAALEPDYLRRFYLSIRSGRDGAVALVRRDGALLLRVPELPLDPRLPYPAARLKAESDKALEGSYHSVSAFDGARRMYFFRHVARRPLLVVVGIGEDEMLEGWRSASLAYGAVSLFFLLLMAGLARLALRELSGRRQSAERLQFLHQHDALTGLPNRTVLADRLMQAIDAARPQHRKLAVLLLNIDRLKRVNEGIGHDAGDQLLAETGARLAARLQPGDTLARLGSDEFVMLMAGGADGGDVNACARQMLDAVAQPFGLQGHALTVTASIGIAVYPDDGTTPGELIKHADSALSHAKQSGRNSFRYFTGEMNVRALHWMSLEHQLRGALERDELLLHYQPQMAVDGGGLSGAEALIRWQNGGALVSPADFIPLAEETRLILPIGEWVIRSACRQGRAWQDAGLPPVRIAVNVSAHQFSAGNVPAVVRAALEESALAPQWLSVELTESVLMKEAGLASGQIAELRAMGIAVALDDFGTGYSSLAYLSRFALDKIKIDQSLVRHVTDDPKSAAIASATIALAHGLGLTVVAEGVETEAQLAFLRAAGCDEIQGYLYGRPVPAARLADLLAGGHLVA